VSPQWSLSLSFPTKTLQRLSSSPYALHAPQLLNKNMCVLRFCTILPESPLSGTQS
jgi:hypothetical protein